MPPRPGGLLVIAGLLALLPLSVETASLSPVAGSSVLWSTPLGYSTELPYGSSTTVADVVVDSASVRSL